MLHSNKQTCTLTLKRVQEGARNCLKSQSINYFTIAACKYNYINENLRKYIIDFIVKITNVFSNRAISEHSATLLKFIYIVWATAKRFFVTTKWNNQTKTKPKSPGD